MRGAAIIPPCLSYYPPVSDQSVQMGSSSPHENEAEKVVSCYEGDTIEQNRVDLMRSIIEAKDPSAKVTDDATLRRFLRARDLNVEKASQLFLKYLKWRQALVPLGYIPESEVSNELRKKKIYIQGFDKQRRPIEVILAARHYASDRDLEEFKRLIVYGFDKLCASMPTGQETFVIIADFEGWGYSNMDTRAYLAALEILQDCYPERLAKAFMIHVPYLFQTAWKMISPFIDKVTKKKVLFPHTIVAHAEHANIQDDVASFMRSSLGN